MEPTTFFVIVIVAVVFSNLLDSAFPKFPLPLVQIICGTLIALSPIDTRLSIDPELFMGILIAPLLFREAEEVDIPGMWKLRKTVMFMVFALVFLTVFVVGFSVHYLAPAIPLAACFCLGAALGPTDAIAVSTVSNRIEINDRIMNILKGEFLINDATGVISFNFAALALVTGTFSVMDASLSLIALCAGGLAVGFVIGQIKGIVTRSLKKALIRSAAAFMLIEILTPFLCFYVAEQIGFSGIIAAVTAGGVQAFRIQRLEKFEAEFASLKKSVWEMITVIFNSVIFILLGLELPTVVENVSSSNDYSVGFALVVGLFATVLLFVVRFLGILLGARDMKEKNTKERFRSWFILTLSGVKGTVSLATAFSLPVIVSGGAAFAHRDILLLITACAIIYSLVISTTLLPLIALPKSVKRKNLSYVRIIREVVKMMDHSDNASTKAAVLHLKRRARELEYEDMASDEKKTLGMVRLEFFTLEKEVLEKSLADRKITEGEYVVYLRVMTMMMGMFEDSYAGKIFKILPFMFGERRKTLKELSRKIGREHLDYTRLREIFWYNTDQVSELLTGKGGNEKEDVISRIVEARIDYASDVMERVFGEDGGYMHEEYDREILRSFDLERNVLSEHLAKGLIDKDEADVIRVDINTLETFAIEDVHNNQVGDLIMKSAKRRRRKLREHRKSKHAGKSRDRKTK